MKSTSSFAVKVAGASSLAILLTTSAFADSRQQSDSWRSGGRDDRSRAESSRDNRGNSYRENERITLQGRVSSFSHEGGGYRVRLDRGNESFWVPESYMRNRANNLRIGVNISLGGVFRGGSVYVDAVSWPDAYDNYGYRDSRYNNDYLRGIVERVDHRRATAFVRDDRSGRTIEVDLRGERRGHLDADDLRRGDFVELSGSFVRGGIFAAERIDRVRSGRY